jgi:uncharacterized RDD family membrane protein YckC
MSAQPIDLQTATNVVGRRVGAFLLDALITGIPSWVLFFALADKYSGPPGGAVYAQVTTGSTTWAVTGGKAALFYLIVLGGGFAYWVVLPGLRGFTPGKAITGIRVIREDGTMPAGIGPNFLRQLLWIVDDIPYFIPCLLGFITASSSSGHRRMGDRVARTYVVTKEAAGRPLMASAAVAATMPPAAGAPPTAPPAAPAPPAAGPPAGWYADPHGQARLRYWDGQRWTEHTIA